ncbi:GPR endopeptidase [Ethanoligenens harbinense]|uniref:GPR endopeptidase n=1 Tax=Ethanoligenens harbinense TaxID=253239 RepID=UPI000EA1B36C|nr:GPR endopeptidase [Ethanoligenens harbinense]AYF39802.1 GPR endopeptidase [Ethanoligenens harbinense]
MTQVRTDLAVEAHEIAKSAGNLSGVESTEETTGHVKLTRVKVLDERGEQAIGKPVGTYVTVEVPGLDDTEGETFLEAVETVGKELAAMLQEMRGEVLVAGLGNAEMTPDAIGPRSVQNVLVTRHVAGELSQISGMEGTRGVAAIAPGVLGQTGVEAGEILKALVMKIRPVAVIAVDALASRRAARLGNTIQIADTGIIPGSGVGNARFAVNKDSLGVPVIALGIPTVVDAATLAVDLIEDAGFHADEGAREKSAAAPARMTRRCSSPHGLST